MPVKHAFTSNVPDNGDAGAIQPSHFNADHVLSGALQKIDAVAPSPNTVLTFDGAGNALLVPLSSIAPAASPALTGAPTAPTPALGTNSNQIATMAAVQAAIAALINGAPGALDTLKELADALGDNANYAATITAALALKATIDSPNFTGTPRAPTVAGSADNSQLLATTAFVQQVAASTLASANNAAGPNALINQNFRIDQRKEGAALALSTVNTYCADRWVTNSAAGVVATAQRNLTGGPSSPNIPSFLRVQRTAGNTGAAAIKLGQIIESGAMTELAGQNCVLSFYARVGANYSAAAGFLGVDVRSGTVADEGNANFFSQTWTGAGSGLSAAATPATGFARYQFAVAVPANALELGVIFTMTPTGTAGAADYFDITGVKLEKGSVATALEIKPYAQVLRECQRYCFRPHAMIGITATIPAWAVRTSNITLDCLISPPVPMFKAVALITNGLTFSNGATPGAGNAVAFYGNSTSGYLTGTGAVTFSLGNSGDPLAVMLRAGATSFNGIAGESGNFYVGTGANILLTAEL